MEPMEGLQLKSIFDEMEKQGLLKSVPAEDQQRLENSIRKHMQDFEITVRQEEAEAHQAACHSYLHF
jgi:hypothetical protein